MKYAKIRKDAIDLLGKGHLVWIPMMRIKYTVNNNTYDKLFDAFLYRYSGSMFVLVAMIRNPDDFIFEESENINGTTMTPLVNDPYEILQDLIDFGQILKEKKKRIYRRARYAPIAQWISLFVPLFGKSYFDSIDQLSIVENALKILNALGLLTKTPKVISYEVIFIPLIIDLKRTIFYEPALSNEKSKGLSFLFKKDKRFYDAMKLLMETHL